jgi:hypothetical protein
MVPVIVNAILNEHQIVVDIVAFVNKGDFPRSRLGEKQRGKILAGWVSRKMRTIAQFAIKDMDREALGPPGTSSGEHSSSGQGGAVDPSSSDQHRGSLGSFRSSSGGHTLSGNHGAAGSSLRNVEPAPRILEHHELEQQQHRHHQHQHHQGYDGMAMTQTPGPIEMPANERDMPFDNDQTPTKSHNQYQQQQGLGLPEPSIPHGFELPSFDRFGEDSHHDGPPPAVGPKPGSSGTGTTGYSQGPPQIRLPGVDGRESLDDWELRPGTGNGNGNGNGGFGQDGGEDDWTRDAYMSMNLAGTLGGK